MIKKISLFLILILVITGCWRDPKPSNTIDRKTFIDMLVDIHIAEAMYIQRTRIGIDSLQSKSLYLSVLKKYKVSEEKMLTTTLYYSRHPKEYDKIFTEVLSKMTVMNDEIQGKKPETQKGKKEELKLK
jgi:hypothetical protein